MLIFTEDILIHSFLLGIDCCSLFELYFPVVSEESAFIDRVG